MLILMNLRANSYSTSLLLLSSALAISAGCGDDGTIDTSATESSGSTGDGSTTGNVDPTTGTTVPTTSTGSTTDPTTGSTTDPTTGTSTTEPGSTGTTETTDTTGTGSTGGSTGSTGGSTGDTGSTGGSTGDTTTGDMGELVGVWFTRNPAALANDAIAGQTPALDAEAPVLKVVGDVVSIESIAVTNGGDGVITYDAPNATGGVIIDEDLANNPVNGAIGLGDRVIAGGKTGLLTPKGLEVGVPGGVFLVADTGAKAIFAFDFDDEGDVAPTYTITDLGSSTAVWDVHYDSDADTLYAAGTNGDVQVYEDFAAMKGAAGPDRTITPFDAGNKVSVNLHGITIVGNRLVLSDVGDANNATDGQLFVIEDPHLAMGNTQVKQRIQGGQLGNPVDLEVRGGLVETLIVAEKSNDSIIRYTRNLITGNYENPTGFMTTKPESVALVPGNVLIVASNPAGLDADAALAVALPINGAPSVTATLNQLGSVTSVQSIQLADNGDGLLSFDGPAKSGGGGVFVVPGLAAIAADGNADAAAGRIWGANTGILTPKGLALDAAGANLFVADTAAVNIKVFDPTILGNVAPLVTFADLGGAAAWDMHYDDATDTLYTAGVDGVVRIFTGALQNGGGAPPDREITPTDGNAKISVNLHGIHYDAVTKILILSDVGDAANNADGQLFLIADADVASGDTEVLAQVGGDMTQLGNPVDIAFDGVNLYVAEKAGSLLLRWDGILSLTGANNTAATVSVAAQNPESVQLEYGMP
jgi:hypothetical protein